MIKNVLIAITVTGIDQLVKCLIRRLPIGFSCPMLPGVVRLRHCTNSGAAFSLLSGQTMLLIVCSLLLMTSIALFVWRMMNLTAAARAACACLIGGGLSNMLDRVCFGGVTDYIELVLFSFPVFNLADIAITVSIAVLMMMTLTGKLERPTGEEHG